MVGPIHDESIDVILHQPRFFLIKTAHHPLVADLGTTFEDTIKDAFLSLQLRKPLGEIPSCHQHLPAIIPGAP